jgi:hypothetical protein
MIAGKRENLMLFFLLPAINSWYWIDCWMCWACLLVFGVYRPCLAWLGMAGQEMLADKMEKVGWVDG